MKRGGLLCSVNAVKSKEQKKRRKEVRVSVDWEDIDTKKKLLFSSQPRADVAGEGGEQSVREGAKLTEVDKVTV